MTTKEREVGLGRNYDLFDEVRFWAYKAVRDYRHLSGKRTHTWGEAVLNYALGCNMLFADPLPCSEIKSIAKSVARYCLRSDPYCYSTFVERQRFKGKLGNDKGASSKGGMAGSSQYEAQRKRALELFVQGRTITQIAKDLDCHRNSIRKWLSNL